MRRVSRPTSPWRSRYTIRDPDTPLATLNSHKVRTVGVGRGLTVGNFHRSKRRKSTQKGSAFASLNRARGDGNSNIAANRLRAGKCPLELLPHAEGDAMPS